MSIYDHYADKKQTKLGDVKMSDKKYPSLKGYATLNINGVEVRVPIALWKYTPKEKEEDVY